MADTMIDPMIATTNLAATPMTSADVASSGLGALPTSTQTTGTIGVAPTSSSLTSGGMQPTSATEYTLSSWFAPFATDYLAKQKALSELQFKPFEGQLTAGPSELQSQAFEGIGNLTAPTPTQFSTDRFTGDIAREYMNPYLQAALEPQLQEARRQAEARRLADAARLTGAGAFGGSRQAIMESEGNRNLLQNLANITGTGYSSAFDKAMQQFNVEQARNLEAQRASEESKRYASDFGLKQLQQELAAGETQRGIEQAGLTSNYQQYLRELGYPQEQLTNLGAALKAMPAYSTWASNTYGQVPGVLQQAAGGIESILGLLGLLGSKNVQSGIGSIFGGGSGGSGGGGGGLFSGIGSLLGGLFGGSGGGGFVPDTSINDTIADLIAENIL